MLTAIQNYVQALSQQYACPPAQLLEVWAATARHDGAAAAACIAQDMEYIWAKEGALLTPLSAVLDKVPLPYGAGIVAMYWWARFQALLRPADLPAATQQGIAQFFQQPLTTMFAPPLVVRVGALRLWVNTKGELSWGGCVLQAGEGYYALYGPRHPQRDLALLPQPSWEVAVSSVMRGLVEVIAQYPLLAPAGAVDWAALTGGEPWAETCAQCGNKLGPRRVCYVCQPEVPPPPLLTPAEYEPRREQLQARIAERLAAQGVVQPAAARRIWRGARALPMGLSTAPAEIWAATLALAHQLELSPPELAVLDWPLAQAAARLRWLGQAAAAQLQPQEQEVYRAVVAQDWPQVEAAAGRHDDLAELLEQPRRLRPLAEHLRVQAEEGGALPRALLYLIAARNAAAGTTGTLVQRLAKLSGAEQLPLLKALQWLAPAEPQALQPLTAALQSSCGSTRLGAAYALAGAVALGREPPVAVLHHSFSTDWHPYVHQAVGDTLALGGVPPCPWCGELLFPARWPHRCLQEATPDELHDLWQGYLGAVGGRQPHPIAQALGRLWARDTALEWAAAVDMLQSTAATPPERIAALSTVLHTVQARVPAPALTALLRSDTPALAELAAQLLVYTATPLTAPDWVAGWQASMATLAAQGHLALAAACIPPAALDAPTQEGIIWFLQQARRCPACGQWYTGPHDCAPSEEQQQALWHLELRLGSAPLQRHPLARHALLCRYQELAMHAGCPPHPWLPILPPLPTPLAGGPELLAASTEAAQLAALEMVATAPPLAALLAWATTLSRSPAAAVQEAVRGKLRQRGLDYCPACQRFSPTDWGHQCPHAALPPAAVAEVPADWQPPSLPPDSRAPTSFSAFAPTLAAMSALTERILTGFPPQGPHATWPLRELKLREAQAALERGAEHLERREAILLLNQLAEATANTLREQRAGRVPAALQEEAQRHLAAVRELVAQLDGRYGPPTLTPQEQTSLRGAYQRWHEGTIEVGLDEADEEHFTVRVRQRPENEWEKSFEVYPAQGRCSGNCEQHLGSRCPHLLLGMQLWRKPQPFTVGEAEQFLAAARRDDWVEQSDSHSPFFYHIERGGFTARVHVRSSAGESGNWASVDVRSRDGLPVELTAPRYDRAALETGLQTCAMCGAQSTEVVGVTGTRHCPACADTVRKAGQATERRFRQENRSGEQR